MIAIIVAVGFPLLLIPFVIWAVKKGRINEQERLRVWSEFAERRGLAYKPPAGNWIRRTSSLIEGDIDGVSVCLDTYAVSTGKSQIQYTRAKTELPNAGMLVLSATRRGFWNGLGEKLGRAPIRMGDSSFDDAVFLRSIDPSGALRVVDRDVQRELARFPKDFVLEVKGAQASLRWIALERDPAVLEAALSIVARMARAARGS